jgi:hypothetical protein
MSAQEVELRDATSGERVPFTLRRLVIAGYTGRDREQVRHHVDELAALGVPPPDAIPAFFDVPPTLLNWSGEIEVAGEETSGEAEPVLFCTSRGWYVGVGSDHTDRAMERTSVSASKSACPKPVSTSTLPVADLADRWDELVLRGLADGRPYQEAPLAAISRLDDIVDGYRRTVGGSLDGLAMFLGTVPLLDGGFRYSRTFRAELWDGARLLLACSYQVTRRS